MNTLSVTKQKPLDREERKKGIKALKGEKFSQKKRPSKDLFLEGPFEKSAVETDGYRSTETMVKEMMLAGVNLELWRKQKYHFGPDQDLEDVLEAPIYPVQASDLADVLAEKQALRESRMTEPTKKPTKEEENDEPKKSDPDKKEESKGPEQPEKAEEKGKAREPEKIDKGVSKN